MEDTFSAILRNPHFSQFAALLGVPFRSWSWKRKQVHVPFWTLWKRCTSLLEDAYFAQPTSRQAFLSTFTELVTTITQADSRLFYRPEDMLWFVQVMDSDRALVTMSILFAYASSKDTYLTPVQVAEATRSSESFWRGRAAAGELVGAFKAGKQWLIPITSLRASGIEDIAATGESRDPDDEEESSEDQTE